MKAWSNFVSVISPETADIPLPLQAIKMAGA
jgi:hypothetical protein